MSSSVNYHWRIAGFYFFYYAFVGMFAPYWSLYLKSLHFDAIDIAILMSLQPVMRMVAPNVWGWLADHTGRRREVVVAAASMSALFYLGVFATTSFWGLFAVLFLMNFFWSASMPLVEATTLTWLGSNTAHYGRLRSWGSIGFIVSVVGLGYAFDHIAIAWLLWAGLVCELGILSFASCVLAVWIEYGWTVAVAIPAVWLGSIWLFASADGGMGLNKRLMSAVFLLTIPATLVLAPIGSGQPAIEVLVGVYLSATILTLKARE